MWTISLQVPKKKAVLIDLLFNVVFSHTQDINSMRESKNNKVTDLIPGSYAHI